MLPIATRKWYRFFMFFFLFLSKKKVRSGIDTPRLKRKFHIMFQVIYVEACESGSIFEGLMPQDLNIYVTTAANPVENSWGTYCPGMDPPPPPEYITCLGDQYSVSWMKDK